MRASAMVGLLALIAGRPVAAQGPTAIVGVVRDESGRALARVTVTVTSTTAAVARQALTDADGSFTVRDLIPADDYRLSVREAGFREFVSELLTVASGQTLMCDVTLNVGLTERLRVAARTQEAPVRQLVPEDVIRDLPLIDRGFLQLTTLAPGFTGQPDYPDTQGQHYWNHNVVVDGASDFSKWRGAPRSFYSGYGSESIREVVILPSLFGADRGGALASVTTAATKAGGQTWSGSAFVFGRHSALASPPVFADAKPSGGTAHYGATIGGPLSDRTFLFSSFDGRAAREHNVVGSPLARGVTVPTTQDERIAFTRFDHRISNTQSVTGRANAQFFRWHDEPGALMLPESGTLYRNTAYTLLFSDAVQWSGRTSNELRGAFSHYVDTRTDLMPTLFVSRAGYSLEGGLLGPVGLGVDPERTWEVHDTLSRVTQAHALTVGGTLALVTAHAASSRYARGAYFFAGEPAVAPQASLFIQAVPTSADSATVDSRSVSATAFVQEEWRAAANLTLNVGARYDVEQVYDVHNYSVPVDGNNLQPRIGLSWHPRHSQTLIRAGAGTYVQQHVLYPIHQVDLQGIDGMATVVLPASSAAFPVFPVVPPADVIFGAAPHDVYRVADRFRNAYSLQAGAGVERSFGSLSASADYLHLNGYDLVSLIDANAPASIAKPAQRSVASADATRPLPPASGVRKLITLTNDGRSWYRALQVRVNTTWPAVRLITAYTLSTAEDRANYELPEDSYNLAAEKGRAPTDVRHNLATAVTWRVPASGVWTRGWTLAAVGMFRSHRPYTITWGDDRNGTTQNDARPGDRNTGRTAPYSAVDLSLARRASRGRATLEVRLEIFNLLNTINYDEYVGALLSPLFGQPISAFPRRRGQLALVVRF